MYANGTDYFLYKRFLCLSLVLKCLLPGFEEYPLPVRIRFHLTRRFISVQWSTKVMTPASMYSLWKQGS